MKSRHLFKIFQSNFFFFADFGLLLLFGLWDEVEVDNLLWMCLFRMKTLYHIPREYYH